YTTPLPFTGTKEEQRQTRSRSDLVRSVTPSVGT
ncbi:hypothetical protein A2U01_0030084, partial [Trifolium medium]|nr:hypothetical protein [Trifolium medium]